MGENLLYELCMSGTVRFLPSRFPLSKKTDHYKIILAMSVDVPAHFCRRLCLGRFCLKDWRQPPWHISGSGPVHASSFLLAALFLLHLF